MNRKSVFLAAAVVSLGFVAAVRADVGKLSYTWTLGSKADLDQNAAAHFSNLDRIGDAGTDGEIAYRALKPKVYQANWRMPAFDIDPNLYNEIKRPFYLTVHFKDISKRPLKFMAYKGGGGFYGQGWIGALGGAGDNQWKDQTLIIPQSMMRSNDGKTFMFGVNGVNDAVPISSMTLFSAASTDVPEKEKIIAGAVKFETEQREAVIAALKKKFKELPPPNPGEAPALQEGESEAGYRVFFPPNARMLYPNSEPRTDELKKSLSLYSTPGQTQFVTIAVKALKDVGQVSVKLSPLSGAAKLENVHIRWAQYRDYRQGSSWSTEYRYLPNVLVEKPVQAATPKQLEVAAITFTLPENAPAGDYKATVEISAEHGQSRQIPLTLKVYPFKLERPDHATHAMFYYANYGEFDPLELIDMAYHGIDGLVTGVSPMTPFKKDKDGKYLKEDEILAGYALLKKLNFKSPMICNLGLQGLLNANTEDNKNVYLRMVKGTAELAAKAGFEPLMFPIDEPHQPDQIKRAKQACTWIREVNLRTYLTSNPKAVKDIGNLLTDVGWNLTYIRPEVIDQTQGAGQAFMFYGPGEEIGGAAQRYRAGYYYAKVQPASSQYFAYFENADDPMNDLDGPNRDWSGMFPSMNSPFHDPSIGWENFREGVNDFLYIHTLRAMAERAAKSGHKAAADKALAAVESVLSSVNRDGGKTGGPELAVEADTRLKNTKVSAEQTDVAGANWYDESRQKIAQAIVDLQASMK